MTLQGGAPSSHKLVYNTYVTIEICVINAGYWNTTLCHCPELLAQDLPQRHLRRDLQQLQPLQWPCVNVPWWGLLARKLGLGWDGPNTKIIWLLSGSDWDGNTVVYCGREKLPAELAPSSWFGFLDGFRLLSSLVFSKFRDMNRFLHFDGLVIEMLEESSPKF
jgi:hypothetical protein